MDQEVTVRADSTPSSNVPGPTGVQDAGAEEVTSEIEATPPRALRRPRKRQAVEDEGTVENVSGPVEPHSVIFEPRRFKRRRVAVVCSGARGSNARQRILASNNSSETFGS